MRFFKPKADWDEAWRRYEAHLRSIRNTLPENARALSSLSFHDAEVKSVKHVSKKALEIVLEGGPYDFLEKKWLGYGSYTLSFSGVKKAWLPYTVVGDCWLHEEMHLSDVAAFDYQVQLAKGGLRIQADDVLMTHGLCV
jgi:hypothetical protein